MSTSHGPNRIQHRKRLIPGTQVLKWQDPDDTNAKPVSRRPMTACKGCRSAKIKCNGKGTCDRCKKKGLPCTYGPSSKTNDKNEGDSASTEFLSDKNIVYDKSLSPNGDHPSNILSHGIDDAMPSTHNALDPWSAETFNHALEEFDWVFPDSAFNNDVSYGGRANTLRSTNVTL